jgi:homoserine O-acetyltransferase
MHRIINRWSMAFGTALAALVLFHARPALAHWPDQAPHQIADLGEFEFEGGGKIPNLRMSYVAHGKLNAAKDNAILFQHGFGANHHLFDHMIGPGRPLDTDKYFVICPDSLGATQTTFEHSSSPTSSGLKMKFPFYNERDIVRSQYRLLTEALGLRRLLAVTGISSGRRQTVQFAVSYPDFMDGAVPIVGGTPFTAQGPLMGSQMTSIIESCRGWDEGRYDENPKTCAATALAELMPYFYTRLVGAKRRHAGGLYEVAKRLGCVLPRHSRCAGPLLPYHCQRTWLDR